MSVPHAQMRATNKKRAKRRGTESKGHFTGRLKREGRWDDYIREREEVSKAMRITNAAAHNEIYDKYAPPDENPQPKEPPGTAQRDTTEPTQPDDILTTAYEDKLPNGCPLFDEQIWKGQAETNLLDDVQWVASHLGLKDFDYINRSPSLRACTLYWEARYTITGMQRYQELVRQLEIPDKATLKDLNKRKDDGAELNRLNDFMQNYAQHIEEEERNAV